MVKRNKKKSQPLDINKQIQLIKEQTRLERERFRRFREEQRAAFRRGVYEFAKGTGKLIGRSLKGYHNLIRGVSHAIDRGSEAAAKAMVRGGRAIGKAAKPYIDAAKEELDRRERIREAGRRAAQKAQEKQRRAEDLKHRAKNSPTGKCQTVKDAVKEARSRAKTETQVSAHARKGTEGVKEHSRKLTPQERNQNVAAEALKSIRNREVFTRDTGKVKRSGYPGWQPIAHPDKTPGQMPDLQKKSKPRPSVQAPIEYQKREGQKQ